MRAFQAHDKGSIPLSRSRHIYKGKTMARITSEKAVDQIGNRYDLVLIASLRARELKNSHAAHINTDDGALVKSIREVEQGHVGKDYLLKNPVVNHKPNNAKPR